MLRSLFNKTKKTTSIPFRIFKEEFKQFNQLDKNKRLLNLWEKRYPCLDDRTETTIFDAHYIYHPAWAIRRILQLAPLKHIDISSTLQFCSMLSAFMPVEFYDYRPANLNLTNLSSGKADLTDLFFETDSIVSLSCMHTVEHIGLGRYGDPIDPEGDVKAINELKRVTAKGGSLFFVVPVGKPKIQFNAHRVYAFEQIKEYFEAFDLADFSLVKDDGSFENQADPELVASQYYSCGCFHFIKR